MELELVMCEISHSSFSSCYHRSSHGPCSAPCNFESWVSDFEVSNMTTGLNVTILIGASVTYPGHSMRVGIPLVLKKSSLPAIPVKTLSPTSEASNATVYFTVDEVKHGFLIK